MNDFLTNLPKIVTYHKKRLGRGAGSGKGAKSGRGITRHQRARESIPAHFEGGQARMVKKFPLLRGKSRNKPLHLAPYPLGLEKLNIFKENEKVTLKLLIAKKVVSPDVEKSGVKILFKGKLEKKLQVMVPTSKSAKSAIVKLGGTVA